MPHTKGFSFLFLSVLYRAIIAAALHHIKVNKGLQPGRNLNQNGFTIPRACRAINLRALFFDIIISLAAAVNNAAALAKVKYGPPRSTRGKYFI